MSHYGKIKSYDTGKGRGMITPETGGQPLAFVKADLQQQAAEPQSGQRFAYETRQVGGGVPQAINLRHQQEQGQTAQPDSQQS